MGNIPASLTALATPEMVRAGANALGESEVSVSKAFAVILPAYLGTILQVPSEKHVTMSSLFLQVAEEPDLSNRLTQALSAQDDSPLLQPGTTFLVTVFGTKMANISNLVSNYAGIKSSSSNELLKAGGVLTASFLGSKMKAENLSLNSILKWIEENKPAIASALPSGFSAITGIAGSAQPFPEKPKLSQPPVEQSPGKRWIFPLILLALLGIGIFWWMKGCNDPAGDLDVSSPVIDSAGISIDSALNKASQGIDSAVKGTPGNVNGRIDSAGNWIAPQGAAIKIKLGNGIEIEGYKDWLEDKLNSFITDQSAKPAEDIWFSFNTLHFENGKSEPQKGYESQLNNVKEVLNAYPDVKIRIGGFTDNSADSMKSLKLSAARAKSVYNKLLAAGVAKTSFDDKPFEGYGAQNPVSDNTTPEGKAQNRRVAINVTEK